MSKKKYRHTDLSNTHKCRICGKGIKERLIQIKTVKPTLCYKHYIKRTEAKINAAALDSLFEAKQRSKRK